MKAISIWSWKNILNYIDELNSKITEEAFQNHIRIYLKDLVLIDRSGNELAYLW